MDAVDWTILSLLLENARMPLKQIASHVFLSAPAVASRIHKLEQEGIIIGYRAVLSQDKLGNKVVAYVHLTLQPELQKTFAGFIEKIPYVEECYHVTGPYSMLMKVCFPDIEQLDEFVAKVQKYGKTHTQIAFSTLKSKSNFSG